MPKIQNGAVCPCRHCRLLHGFIRSWESCYNDDQTVKDLVGVVCGVTIASLPTPVPGHAPIALHNFQWI